MTLSIRTRLLVWVLGGMALLLAAFAVVAYEVLSLALVGSFDAVLASTARTVTAAVEQTHGEVTADFAETDLSDFQRTDRPDAFQIWLDDGSTLASSRPAGATGLSPFSGQEGELLFRVVSLPAGRPGRAVGLRFVPTIDDEEGAPPVPRSATLVVARGTEDLNAQLGLLWWLLTAGAGTTMILSLVVGAIAVRHGLRPLDRLAKHIAAIRHDDLGAPVVADRMPAELAPLVDRLNDMLNRLQRAFQRERTFTADAAHELRTPLAGLRSTIEVTLLQRRGAEEYREALAACLHIVLRTQALVDTLLELARLESGRTPARREWVNLGEVVEAAWRAFEDRARDRQLSVERRVGPNLAGNSDRASMMVALGAVFTNAVDFTDTGGRIDIVAGRDGGMIWIETSNSGCELGPGEVDHVFERFWQGDAARSRTGTHYGLGLALAERAVATAGGTTSASVSNRTFTLRLTLQADLGTPECGPAS
jgi:two-component system OmpR family sensor kinase